MLHESPFTQEFPHQGPAKLPQKARENRILRHLSLGANISNATPRHAPRSSQLFQKSQTVMEMQTGTFGQAFSSTRQDFLQMHSSLQCQLKAQNQKESLRMNSQGRQATSSSRLKASLAAGACGLDMLFHSSGHSRLSELSRPRAV